MNMDVLTAAKNVGSDYHGGVVALAPQIGKNHNSLGAELRGDGTAKLGLLDAVKMSIEARDYRILDAFALACGRRCLPLPSTNGASTRDCIEAMGKAAREFSELCAEVLQAHSNDGKFSDNERERIQIEGGHVFTAIGDLLGAVEASNEAGKPPHLRAAA